MLKKIAILTDIHGNNCALKAVLREIDHTQDVSHIYCLGDMIGIGTQTNEVLELLFSRNDVSMISGNHDEAVIALYKGENYPNSLIHHRPHHEIIANQIQSKFINQLNNLPRILRENTKNYSMLFIHYHIKKERLLDHISLDPFSPFVEPSLNNMDRYFSDYTEDIICFGHHHPVHWFKRQNRVYLNPGALGCNNVPVARYAILTLFENHVQVEIKESPYDNSRLIASYHEQNIPNKEFYLKVFHGIA